MEFCRMLTSRLGYYPHPPQFGMALVKHTNDTEAQRVFSDALVEIDTVEVATPISRIKLPRSVPDAVSLLRSVLQPSVSSTVQLQKQFETVIRERQTSVLSDSDGTPVAMLAFHDDGTVSIATGTALSKILHRFDNKHPEALQAFLRMKN
jgi:hypothetical protein